MKSFLMIPKTAWQTDHYEENVAEAGGAFEAPPMPASLAGQRFKRVAPTRGDHQPGRPITHGFETFT